MFINHKYNYIIISTEKAAQIASLIQGAFLSSDFDNVVYVPWTLKNAQTLAELDFVYVNSPIEKEYSWAGNKTPYKHQIKQAAFCTVNKRGFILSGMGSGKTLSALWAADYLMEKGYAKKCLIITNLSTLDCVWGDTLFYDFYHRKTAILIGTAKRRRTLFNDTKYDFYVINHDGFQTIKKDFRTRNDIDIVIIDESTAYKNPKTDRFRNINKLLSNIKYVWALTATPTPNAPIEAWGQARLLNTHRGYTYTQFRDMTMIKVSQFRWVPRNDAHKIVASILYPSIRFETRECIDLPPTVYSFRQAQLSPAQKKAYSLIMNKLVAEFHAGKVTAVNEADRQNKLLQVACGFLYLRKNPKVIIPYHIDTKPRLAVIDEILETVTDKVVIFAPFTYLLEVIKKHLQHKRKCAIVSGDTSRNERYEIFTQFQTTDKLDCIIAHPRTMAHGVDLTAASVIIWYAPYLSNEHYTQANARIVRPKQTKITNIIHIEATSLEKKLYTNLTKRESVQGVLLSYLKELQHAKHR